jgi:3-dehydroquinate dehydratase-2
VLTPGGYTHTSVAIRDAIEAVAIPTVEVHLSNPEEREEQWRHNSVIAGLATKRILGRGPEGYREALEFLGETS